MAKETPQELSEQARERITDVVRSLVDDRVERGIDLSRPMHCDSCDQEKSAAGSAQYGAYKLCNDCLLDFTIALATGQAENVADYMTRRGDDSVLPAELSTNRDRSSLQMGPLPARDTLLPRNEPC